MRVTLTPAGSWQTPIARRMGVREIEAEIVDGLVTFGETSYAVDPLTGDSEIAEVEVELRTDGRRDYRSFVEDLFATYHIGELELDVMIGHPDLAREHWGHVDSFLIDDYTVDNQRGVLILYCVSPLSLALVTIPPESSGTRTAISYTAETDKAIYDDLVSSQLVIPGRYLGPGVSNTSEERTKTLREPRKGFEELYRIAFLAGGSLITSQGRLKYVDLYNDESEPDPRSHFLHDEITVLGVSPGFRTRITQFQAGYGWSDSRGPSGDFRRTAHSEAQQNIRDNLGRALIDINETLDEETAKYLLQTIDAQTIAQRMIDYFSTGMMLVRFRSHMLKPFLEPGDPVVVETDAFVGRDPNSGNAVRGRNAFYGKVQRLHDFVGQEFTVWVRTWADIVATNQDVTHTGYLGGRVRSGVGIFVTTDPDTGETVVQAASPNAASGEVLRPDSTVDATDWTATPHDETNDQDDSTFASSTGTSSTSEVMQDFEVGLGNPTTDPDAEDDVKLRIRARMVEDSGTGHTVYIIYKLREGSTVRASFVTQTLTTSFGWFEAIISDAVKAAVTNWDNVSVLIEAYQKTAAGGTDDVHTDVSQIELNWGVQVTLADQDATPSVAGGDFFKTGNTVATTITDLDDGLAGQQVTLEIGDGNTTVDFTGTNLKGNGGSDWSPTSGDYMVCRYNGSEWLCSVHTT